MINGIGTGFVALNMMGFNIDEYFAVGNNPTAQKVADANSNGKINRSALGNDVHQVTRAMLAGLGRIDILLITPDCGPWSSLLEEPEGFGTNKMSEGGKLFVSCAEVKDDLMDLNPALKFWCETNCVSDRRGDQWKRG